MWNAQNRDADRKFITDILTGLEKFFLLPPLTPCVRRVSIVFVFSHVSFIWVFASFRRIGSYMDQSCCFYSSFFCTPTCALASAVTLCHFILRPLRTDNKIKRKKNQIKWNERKTQRTRWTMSRRMLLYLCEQYLKYDKSSIKMLIPIYSNGIYIRTLTGIGESNLVWKLTHSILMLNDTLRGVSGSHSIFRVIIYSRSVGIRKSRFNLFSSLLRHSKEFQWFFLTRIPCLHNFLDHSEALYDSSKSIRIVCGVNFDFKMHTSISVSVHLIEVCTKRHAPLKPQIVEYTVLVLKICFFFVLFVSCGQAAAAKCVSNISPNNAQNQQKLFCASDCYNCQTFGRSACNVSFVWCTDCRHTRYKINSPVFRRIRRIRRIRSDIFQANPFLIKIFRFD